MSVSHSLVCQESRFNLSTDHSLHHLYILISIQKKGPGGMVGINAKSIVEISTKGSEEVLKLGIKLVDQAGTQHQIDQILQHRTEPVLFCI